MKRQGELAVKYYHQRWFNRFNIKEVARGGEVDFFVLLRDRRQRRKKIKLRNLDNRIGV